MVTDTHFKLTRDTISSLPIKEHLGHKILGIEPDLVFDFKLNTPRLFIRSPLIDIFGDDMNFEEAAYINSKATKVHRSFACLLPGEYSEKDCPNLFLLENVLYLSYKIIDSINTSSGIIDIEIRTT